MPHDPEKYLHDMLDRASFIIDILMGKSVDDLNADRLLRSAVEREFSVIGEALMQLHRLDPKVAEQIDGWQRIIGFRHVHVHGYAALEMHTIFEIARTKLPTLVDQLELLLRERKTDA